VHSVQVYDDTDVSNCARLLQLARRCRIWLLVDRRRRPMIKGTETGCTLARSAAGTGARSSQPVYWVWCAAGGGVPLPVTDPFHWHGAARSVGRSVGRRLAAIDQRQLLVLATTTTHRDARKYASWTPTSWQVACLMPGCRIARTNCRCR